MKKTILLAGVASVLFALNTNAAEFKPYVGVDYVYDDVGMKSEADDFFQTKYNSFKIDLGAKINKNFGLEGFYQKSGEEHQSYQGILGVSSEFEVYGVDAIGYLPLTDKLEGLGSIGLAKYEFKAEYNIDRYGTETENEDNWGVRFGLGLQYNITDNVALNGMARYIKIDNSSNDVVEDMAEFSVGARYSF